jgi:hypothetical protein
VGPPDFKSGVPSEEGGRWVRFPCTSANNLLDLLKLLTPRASKIMAPEWHQMLDAQVRILVPQPPNYLISLNIIG